MGRRGEFRWPQQRQLLAIIMVLTVGLALGCSNPNGTVISKSGDTSSYPAFVDRVSHGFRVGWHWL